MNFMILALIFKSLIHCEFILIYDVGRDPTSFFACGYPVVWAPSAEKTIPHYIFIKNKLAINVWILNSIWSIYIDVYVYT